MKIAVELELDVVEYIDGNGRVSLDAVRFDGDTHDQLSHMNEMARIKVQAEVEAAVEKRQQEERDEIRERKEMAGDHRRELGRDDMLASHARAAHKAIFGSNV